MKRMICLALALFLLCAILPNVSVTVDAVASGAGEREIEGAKRDFTWPVPGKYGLSGCFLDGRGHYAIDIPATKGTKVVAAYDGTVHAVYSSCTHNSSKDYTCCNDGFGNYVVIKHSYTLSTGSSVTLYSRYSHLTAVSVSKGDKVTAGTKIGTVGSTGYSQGNHLDFQILKGGWKNREEYSLDPFINELLELPSEIYTASTNSCCGVGPTGCCCYEYIQDVKKIYANHPYLNLCSTYYSYCQIEATANTSAMSLPCSTGTNEESTVLESVSKGSVYTATKLVLNDQGNYWYRIETADGETAYVPSSKMQYQSSLNSDITISGATAPTTLQKGKTFSIEGKIKSTYNKITKVSAYVYSGSSATGDPVTGGAATVNGKSYSLAGSEVDNEVLFNELAVGTYTYAVYAEYKSYYAETETTREDVTGKVCLYTATFKVKKTASSCSHSYSSEITTAATCTSNGVRTYTCSKCNATKTEQIAALGHNYEADVTMPTCTDEGYTTHTCDACQDSYVDSYTEAYGHTVVTDAKVDPTCTETGLKEGSHCSVCETALVLQEVIPANGHDYNSVTIEPTYETPGYTIHTCAICGYSIMDSQVPPLERVYPVEVVYADGSAAQFETLKEALAVAGAGDTITLMADIYEAEVLLRSGVVLDLRNHTLTTDFIIGMKGSAITAALHTEANMGGKLVVPQDSISLSSAAAAGPNAGYKVIPVWNEDHYVFAQVKIVEYGEYGALTLLDDNTVKLEFLPNLTAYVRDNLFKPDGCADNDVSIIIRVSWIEKQSQGDIEITKEYFYTTSLVQYAMNKYALTATTTECDTKEGLEFTIAVISDIGTEICTQTYVYDDYVTT